MEKPTETPNFTDVIAKRKMPEDWETLINVMDLIKKKLKGYEGSCVVSV